MFKYLSFTGQSGCYANLPLAVLAGASTFTIEFKLATTSTKSSSNNWTWGTIAGREIGGNWQDDFGFCVNNGKLCFWAEPVGKNSLTAGTGGVVSNAVVNDGSLHKVAVVSSNGAIDLYCDSALVAHTVGVNAKITDSQTILLAQNSDSASYLQMDLYEARFWNVARTQEQIFADIDGTESGLQGWYLPSADGLLDYSGNGRHATLYGSPAYTELTELLVTLNFDVERHVNNASWTWRYENAGVAELLTTRGTTLKVDTTKSVTGFAFYVNPSNSDCFNTPAGVKEVWFKFDMFIDSAAASGNRFSFGHYSSALGGYVGIWNDISTPAKFLCDAKPRTAINTGLTGTRGAINHVALHMVSSAANGLIELNVNGATYTFSGYVNNGADFDTLYFYSNTEKILFSNIIISSEEIKNGEGWHNISFDVARCLSNRVELSVDVARVITNSNFISVNQSFDVARKIVKSVSFIVDVQRRAVNRPIVFEIDIDVVRKVKKLGKLRAWLPFDKSVTEDICGNTWQTVGNPTIGRKNAIIGSALQLDGQSYLKLSNIMLGGQHFEISGWVYVDSSSPNYARVLNIVNPDNGYMLASVRKSPNDATKLDFWANSYADVSQDNGYTYTSSINSVGERVHFKLLYNTSQQFLWLFINDKSAAKWTNPPAYTRRAFDIYIGNNTRLTQGVIGSVDELLIYDGIHYAAGNDTPPTVDDYITQRLTVLGEADISFTVDVQRKIKNAPLTWRYENAGDANDLILASTVLTDLPVTKSTTGTAFYQTTRAKCFDLPTTSDIWLKFDVYFDGSNRWRAYNGGVNGTTGVTAQTNGALDYYYNGSNRAKLIDGVCKTNKLQTVLLHMISGTTAGIIEAWVDGIKIYTYTGDVNHGQDFADIYLQSDGSGTFFSNVIISNSEIDLAETLGGKSVVVLFDVEISIGRLISLYLDTKCIVITQETVEQLAKFSSALKVWLPFDTSPIADVCGNEWTVIGNPTIQNKKLALDRFSCLTMYLPFTITRLQTFTVSCWFSATHNISSLLWSMSSGNITWRFFISSQNTLEWGIAGGSGSTTVASTGVTDGKEHYLEAIFDSGVALAINLDGVRVAYITKSLPNYWSNSSITTQDFEVCIGAASYDIITPGAFTRTIDEFQIYDGVALHGRNFVPPVKASYTALHSKILENPINVIVDVMRVVKDDTVLKAHLTFDEDIITDECGNEWTVVGNPTISEEHAVKGKALQLDGESYLKCNSTFTIEVSQPFTIDCWVYAAKLSSDSTPLWSLVSGNETIVFFVNATDFVDSGKQVYHCALVSDGLNVYYFIDGTLIRQVSLITYVEKQYSGNTVVRSFLSSTVLDKLYYAIQNAELYVGRYSSNLFTGTIDEFRLIIGDALWTKSFTPSITGEILDWSYEVTLNCDVMYIVNNVEEPWIYYGISVPYRISYGILFRSNLPANVSRIVMRDLEITFPVPTTYNFWIRFDFNPGSVGFFVSQHKSKYYGVVCSFDTNTSRTTALLYILCGSYYGNTVSISGNATSDASADVLHTVLLHIKSGLTDGIIEAWVDKTKSGKVNYLIERYVGNVNDGVPIYDFIIRSGDHCSNIIISNEPITFDSEIPEAHIIELVLDVERQLTSNFVTYDLDVIRNVIAPITIPLSEENIEYTLNRIRICSIPQKFILPKISKFYIYGDLVGKVHIYSDTNVEGIINGSYYFTKNSIQSEFIESNEFYIVLDTSIISAQDVIKLFIYKLVTNRLSGTSALNRAVIYATDGRYVSWNDFINQFLNCLNSIDYKRFLDFYCDIVLDNNDTGAILGWDAGGVAVRTAISVVTESSSTDAWKIPVLGSSVMIRNLLVHFPRYGVDFNLTNLEKYILSGLNSEWIYRSLELIQYSFGISFEDSDITYEMYIQFSRDSSSNNLAYTSAGENDTSCIVTINMYYYSSMDITDVNGLSEYDNMYLDRTIVHELVHAVMKLRSYAHYTLPTYIIEGLAELVHGIDDYRKNNIVDLLTARKNDLISALTSEQYAYPEDAYSAGYILLRFLAKQGQHINNTSSNKLIINNLLVVNDLSLVIKTVECDVTTLINNYVITQCDVTILINNYVITQCDVTINHYMIIEYVLDVYCEFAVSIIEFISVQINVMHVYIISADVFRRIIGLNVTKFNIMMYGVSNVHINSVVFNIVMYGISSSISSSIKFVVVDPSKTRTKLHQCIKPVVMLMLKPINNIMIADQVSDLALRSTPLYPDRSNKGYNTRR